jgi:hypothetical protein
MSSLPIFWLDVAVYATAHTGAIERYFVGSSLKLPILIAALCRQ